MFMAAQLIGLLINIYQLTLLPLTVRVLKKGGKHLNKWSSLNGTIFGIIQMMLM